VWAGLDNADRDGNVPAWLADLVVIACSAADREAKTEIAIRIGAIIRQDGDPWPALMAAGGFRDWPATQQSLSVSA